jgi:hypothetical protein
MSRELLARVYTNTLENNSSIIRINDQKENGRIVLNNSDEQRSV